MGPKILLPTENTLITAYYYMLHEFCSSVINMADVIRRVILFVLSQHCYDEYFINFNFFDGGCISLYAFIIVYRKP
jgi:hypothetical protein